MKKQSEYNKRSETKRNLVRFVALVTTDLRKSCKASGIPYCRIVEKGLKACLESEAEDDNKS